MSTTAAFRSQGTLTTVGGSFWERRSLQGEKCRQCPLRAMQRLRISSFLWGTERKAAYSTCLARVRDNGDTSLGAVRLAISRPA